MILVLPQAMDFAVRYEERRTALKAYSTLPGSYGVLSKSPVAALLPESGCKLVIWGWAPQIYVESGCRPMVRSVVTYYEMIANLSPSLKEYHLQRYLFDLERGRPEYFIDAVRPGDMFFSDEAFRHERFDAIARAIEFNFSLVTEIDGYRLYRRTSEAQAQ